MWNRTYLLPQASPCEDKGCLLCQTRATCPEEAVGSAFIMSAKSGGYVNVAIAVHFREQNAIIEQCQKIEEAGLRPILQVSATEVLKNFESLKSNPAFEGKVIGRAQWEVIGRAHDLKKIFVQLTPHTLANISRWTLFWSSETDLCEVWDFLPSQVREKLRLYVPYSPNSKRNAYYATCTQQIETLQRKHHTKIKPPDYEIYNPNVLATDREPQVLAERLCSTGSSRPKLSYIIPLYNSGSSFPQKLDHLLKVDQDRTNYEVIVVDDGSSDAPLKSIKPLLERRRNDFNLKWIEFPRSQPRSFWDHSFRAGIARNLGVKSAEGELLCFCDADILVPSSYSSYLLQAHQSADIIQARRRELPGKIPVKNWTDQFIQEHGLHRSEFWQEFEERAMTWNSWDNRWQYVSTYLLSIKQSDFLNLGRFRTSFGSYGFEDTDLGHRAVQAGLTLSLAPHVAGHVASGRRGSEYFGHQILKDLMLVRSIPTFFVNTLDPAIHHRMCDYFDYRNILRKWLHKWPSLSKTQVIFLQKEEH